MDATRRPSYLAAATAVLAAGIYSLLAYVQWIGLVTPSWDLAIFSQLAKAYSTCSPPIVPLKGEGFNLLGDHFHPILVLLGPVWALWPSPKALLVLQAVLFGLSAFPLTRLAARRQGLGWGAVFGVAYAFSWGLQPAAAVQFHEIAFAVPLFAFALTAHLEGRPRAAAAWAAALVFVKADLGLTVLVFGLVMAWRRPRGFMVEPLAVERMRRRLGFGLAIWGVVWFVLATYVILPAFNPGGEYAYSDRLAGLLQFFVPAEKWLTVVMLVTSTGLIGLRSPLVLLVLPTLIWRFIGDVPAYWGHRWHYSAVLMPVVFAALLDGMAGRPTLRWRWLPPVLAAATTLALGPSMSLARLTDPQSYRGTERWEAAMAVVSMIPEGSTVESDPVLMAPLVPRAEVYAFQNDNPAPDFVVVDEGTPTWGPEGPPPDAAVWASQRHQVPYELLFDSAGFQLAGRVDLG
ncbi:MAG: DUF2079 domain-containing protein [Brooklawnia sp.]|nr:DUF2079 domain-containing protein [Brooklawnia sp.]